MAGNSTAEPGSAADQPRRGEAGSTASAGSAAEQRCGPLELRRMRKDDGRSLIVYSRADEPSRS
jgi:hypothetical protein